MFAKFSLCLIAKIFEFFFYFFLNQIKYLINKNKKIKKIKKIKIKIKTFFFERPKFFFNIYIKKIKIK